MLNLLSYSVSGAEQGQSHSSGLWVHLLHRRETTVLPDMPVLIRSLQSNCWATSGKSPIIADIGHFENTDASVPTVYGRRKRKHCLSSYVPLWYHTWLLSIRIIWIEKR